MIEWINNWYIYTMGYHIINEKGQMNIHNMDKSYKHDVDQKKADPIAYIHKYGFIY